MIKFFRSRSLAVKHFLKLNPWFVGCLNSYIDKNYLFHDFCEITGKKIYGVLEI